jgi:hypothetical protein
VPATSAAQNSLLFFFFSAAAAYRTNKQTRQALSNLFYAFDIYGKYPFPALLDPLFLTSIEAIDIEKNILLKVCYVLLLVPPF